MRRALDDHAPAFGDSVAVDLETTRPPITALYSLVPWAVRKSTVRRWVAKLTGKISGFPPRIVTNRPNDMLDSKLQHSSSLSTVTGASSADMIQPNAMGISARSDAMADECRPWHGTGGAPWDLFESLGARFETLLFPLRHHRCADADALRGPGTGHLPGQHR